MVHVKRGAVRLLCHCATTCSALTGASLVTSSSVPSTPEDVAKEALAAYKSMLRYFNFSVAEPWPGRPITSLPRLLKADLKTVPDELQRLTCLANLQALRSTAANKIWWKVLTEQIVAEYAPPSPSTRTSTAQKIPLLADKRE
ncbi:hypothetical protein H257_08116 [Aphanomyces astaci]|uniref:Uncharacterized protein n=1 Tax=Aphanomyces astaci TaxID=112090 RepID=W4GHX7_APHAT|nr:hypothetical protein H257_08116 [Aphanomyces astaci]ETV78624.1 hypothetical protein H257_08116 [Aphanomyces astaci]|eukprot:XP_009832205.1 hypothetical protein H257_08116 [Aphanomyces astaci]